MGIPIPNPHTHEYGYGDLKSSQHCYGSPGSRRPESKRTTLRPPPVANSWLRNCSRQIVRLLETTEIAQNVPNYRPRLFEAARRCSRSHMCDGQRSKHEEVKLCALRMRSQARHAWRHHRRRRRSEPQRSCGRRVEGGLIQETVCVCACELHRAFVCMANCVSRTFTVCRWCVTPCAHVTSVLQDTPVSYYRLAAVGLQALYCLALYCTTYDLPSMVVGNTLLTLLSAASQVVGLSIYVSCWICNDA